MKSIETAADADTDHPTGVQSEGIAQTPPSTADPAGGGLGVAWHPALWVVLAAALSWTVVMGTLVWQRHDRLGSFSFDMGIFDQAVWLLSRGGQQLMTVRGLTVFGHHAEPALYLLAPFYWLGAGPHFLNLVQVAAMALGAVPVFLIARDRLGAPWVAAVIAGAFLLHPALAFMAWELFHPEAMAITPLLFAYWFAGRRRWRWFAVCVVLAVAWKEDVALAAAVLGLVVAVRGERRVGLTTAALSVGYFLMVTRVLLPYLNGSEAFYNQFFGELGGSAPEIIRNGLRRPELVTDRVLAADAKDYYWKMVAPFGLVPLAGPGALLVGVPQALVNVLSINDFTRKITYHYAALPLTGLTLAAIEGARWIAAGRRRALVILAGVMAVSSVAAAMVWGPTPIGATYGPTWWPPAQDSRRDAKEAALARVPNDARVSATYLFVPQLTHREGIYEFPNPFKPKNWGVRDENYPPPTAVSWLVVDRDTLGPEDAGIFDCLLATSFQIVSDEERVVVARRHGAGSSPLSEEDSRPSGGNSPPPGENTRLGRRC